MMLFKDKDELRVDIFDRTMSKLSQEEVRKVLKDSQLRIALFEQVEKNVETEFALQEKSKETSEASSEASFKM